MSPNWPAERPQPLAPRLWQASSNTGMPCRFATSMMAGISASWPKRCTGTMALVRGVMAASTSFPVVLKVAGSRSTKTGVAPR